MDGVRCGVAVTLAALLVTVPRAARNAGGSPGGGRGDPLPASHLAVRTATGWATWWRAAAAPVAWSAADSLVAQRVAWHAGAAGTAWGELELAGSGEAWRTQVILVRLDPRQLRFRVDTGFTPPLRPAWNLERVPLAAVLAMNAGQFLDGLPWGWVVIDGRQMQPPGHGPLAVAVAADSSGTVYWIQDDSLHRTRVGHVAWAFESYPALLRSDTVPAPLRADGRGLDVGHRDARLAIGRLRDGQLLVALTRFDALGGAFGAIPFGLTVPEMAALMGALGCRDAVLLDGGISAQLLVRDPRGSARTWRGLRRVPLALLAFPR
jgi:Phosphodiester glycosidase